MAGRPTDLTPEVIEDVRRILPTVMYLESVADYLGISRETIRQWCKRGRREQKRLRHPKAKPKPKEAIYLQFIGVYKKALAEGEIHDAGVIKKASSEQWQAAAWRLERRFHDRWGNQNAELRLLKKEIEELKRSVINSPTPQAGQANPGISQPPA